MSDPSTTPVMLTDRHREALSSAQAQVNRVVLGKQTAVVMSFVALLADGHILIEDLPGMDELPISADAVRCMPVKVPAGCVYHVGVCFENYLSRPMRTHLLHAINVLQRQVLHKGIR